MRTLILTCNTGGGHNSCAAAIQQVFREHGMVCDVADAMHFSSGRLSRFLSWGHTAMYRHAPGLFRWGYGFAERHPGAMREDAAVYRLLSAGAERLYTYICEDQYDTVICVHVFSDVLLSELLRKHPSGLKTAFVATDYTCSPGTAVSHLDRYFIPHEALADEFAAQGIPRGKIVPCGIPVARSFYSSRPKDRAKESVGIPAEHPHLLMMCGSMGCGPLEELTELLRAKMEPTMELSIVCGTNEKLRQSLESMAGDDPRIHICGFTENMDALMDSADLCLTKPGGLSTTEAAAKGLPMVLIDAVAGCETHNMKFFVDRGGAVTAENTEELAEACIALLNDPEKRLSMAKSLAEIAGRPAAETIFSVLAGE